MALAIQTVSMLFRHSLKISLLSFQEYMAKARELERELRSLTIEKARADAMLEVCIVFTHDTIMQHHKFVLAQVSAMGIYIYPEFEETHCHE